MIQHFKMLRYSLHRSLFPAITMSANDSVNFISNSTTSGIHSRSFVNSEILLSTECRLLVRHRVYTVTLTVTSSTGVATVQALINIRPTPEVNFTTQNACLNDTTSSKTLQLFRQGRSLETHGILEMGIVVMLLSLIIFIMHQAHIK